MNNIETKCFISKCGEYRWSLELSISRRKKEICFIGLNPSLSNENFFDNTTKKIIKISQYCNYGKIKIINLFGIISSYPELLLGHQDPIGFLNDQIILSSLKCWSCNNNCNLWLGWGNKGNLFNRDLKIYKLIKKYFDLKKNIFNNPTAPLIIKKTKLNNPIHPLYCKDRSSLTEYLEIC